MEGVFGEKKITKNRKRLEKRDADALAAALIKKLCTGALDGC